MLHTVVTRTDVYVGPDPYDNESVWATTESDIQQVDDSMVDTILKQFGEEREDAPVQVIVDPIGEFEMRVIEIHAGNKSYCPDCGELAEVETYEVETGYTIVQRTSCEACRDV